MQALIAAPETAGGFQFAEVPEPVPEPGQVLVEVRHASVNFGEVRYLGFQAAGAVLGYDAAGHVVQAADGAGPAVGDRVVAFGAGAWAPRAVFPVDSLAVVPNGLDLVEAAALPMVGITALRTLRAAGSLLGRRVLVTGASGGVGRLAVQLGGSAAHTSWPRSARRRGARACDRSAHTRWWSGWTGSTSRSTWCWTPSAGITWSPPGGCSGRAGRFRASAGPRVSRRCSRPDSIFAPGPAKRLQSFGDASHPGPDLTVLLGLVATGAITVPVGWRDSWKRLDQAIEALLGRQVAGKAVIDID